MSKNTNSSNTAKKNWWLMLILGIIFISTGGIIISNPAESYLFFNIYFVITFFITSFVYIFSLISNPNKNWGMALAIGLLNGIVATYLLINPEISLITLPVIVGFTVIFQSVGIIEFSSFLKAMEEKNWWLILLLGLAVMTLGFAIIANPMLGVGTFLTWTSFAFIAAGITTILISFEMKKF